jgi:hypothetical protein
MILTWENCLKTGGKHQSFFLFEAFGLLEFYTAYFVNECMTFRVEQSKGMPGAGGCIIVKGMVIGY